MISTLAQKNSYTCERARKSRIPIVTLDFLLECKSKDALVDETPFLVSEGRILLTLNSFLALDTESVGLVLLFLFF